MSFSETFLLAMKNIRSSKMRTFLTMLGIIIGVTAVIVIVGLGSGTQGYIRDSFADMDTDSLNVMVMGRGSSRSVSEEDMYAMVDEHSDMLKAISPTVNMMSSVKIGGTTFTIVGVLDQQGSELEEGGSDDCIYLPYSTAARLSFTGTISSYVITVQDTDQISQAKMLVEQELYSVFSDDSAYTVTSMAELVDEMNSMVNMIIYILAGIAAISLVVGGIGIMNIMLVSVTERTREIGIRKALGARESAIMRQFVIEAATTSSLGGVLGIILGCILSAGATTLIAAVLPDTPITVTPTLLAVAVAFGVSTGIGVVFGYLPAKNAHVR